MDRGCDLSDRPPAGACPVTAETNTVGEATARPVRTRNAERTRERILSAAVAEFSEKGFDAARVDEIAARAGVNKRMLYHYFGDKDDLFLAVLERTYDDIRSREAGLELSALDPESAMRKLIRFSFGYYRENENFIRLLNSENLHSARHLKASRRVPEMHSPLVAMIRDILDRGVADGIFRPGVDPVQLYISIAGLGYFYFSNIHTLSTIFAADLGSEPARGRRLAFVTDQIVSFLKSTPDALADAPRSKKNGEAKR